MSSNAFNFVKACSEPGYLSGYCEGLYEKYEYKEESLFENMPERMVFEIEIWMLGEKIRLELAKVKKVREESYSAKRYLQRFKHLSVARAERVL